MATSALTSKHAGDTERRHRAQLAVRKNSTSRNSTPTTKNSSGLRTLNPYSPPPPNGTNGSTEERLRNLGAKWGGRLAGAALSPVAGKVVTKLLQNKMIFWGTIISIALSNLMLIIWFLLPIILSFFALAYVCHNYGTWTWVASFFHAGAALLNTLCNVI